MRAYKRFDNRGFTLVELMIVVAIVGVLATLGLVGYKRLIASSKTAEAKTNVGAIVKAAVTVYEGESLKNELLGEGAVGTTPTHTLCGTAANRVPATPPAGAKYQPSTVDLQDFNTGDPENGWKCLRYSITQPISYSYGYDKGVGTGLSTATGFEANAFGDIDGDGGGTAARGANIATFARGGLIRGNGDLVLTTSIATENEAE
jgi:type IV pilus assembly protein PilA